MNTAIQIQERYKTFEVQQRATRFTGSLKALFCAQKQKKLAIQNLNFKIQAGKNIAFTGLHGVDKSTTLKMLTGILHPREKIRVLGLIPGAQRQKLGYHIGTVFGQRTQLWYHLPPSNTFALLGIIYEVKLRDYQKRLKHLFDCVKIGPLLDTLVRQLSLGERIRCEIVVRLVHQPAILSLDEPTIDLRIHAKLKIRGLLNQLCPDHGTTLFLTDHNTTAIEQVCNQSLVFDRGRIVLDNSLQAFKKTYTKKKIITLTTESQNGRLTLPGLQMESENPLGTRL